MKGLSHRFTLSNGSFALTSGAEKAKDNLSFFSFFTSISKIYDQDFNTGMLFLIQKPISAIETYKNLILGRLKLNILKYVPNIVIDDISLQYSKLAGNERSTSFVTTYRFIDDIDTQEQVITFV
jgi:hypothetical protein